jgi:exportin-1
MACDTFIKIAQKCRRHFVILQSQETEPFVDEILRLLHRITVDLSPQQVCPPVVPRNFSAHLMRSPQVHTFYEAVGYMIAAQPNKAQQEKLIAKLMELPNNAVRPASRNTIFCIDVASTKWDSLMSQVRAGFIPHDCT